MCAGHALPIDEFREQKAEVPADPDADNVSNGMDGSQDTPEDPGAEGEGENSSDG